MSDVSSQGNDSECARKDIVGWMKEIAGILREQSRNATEDTENRPPLKLRPGEHGGFGVAGLQMGE